MRRLILAAFILAAASGRADALTPLTLRAALPSCSDTTGGASVVCGDEYLVEAENIISTATDTAASTVSDVRYIAYKVLEPGGGANGDACARTVYRPEGPESGLPGERAGEIAKNFADGAPDCPVAPGAESVVPESPATFAIRYWQDIPLPAPQPYIAPGRAITGMFAYLETRGSTTHTYTEPNTPFGPLQIVAQGAYYVDWGDGTNTGPHSAEGGPWPDGQITHEYLRIGAYDVVVTERWTATWSFGSASGTLDELRTVGRIEDFPVQQIQAVVLR